MAYHGGPVDGGGPGPDDPAFSARIPCCCCCCCWRRPGGGEGGRQEGEAEEGGDKEVEVGVEAAAAVVEGETWRRPVRTWRPHARHLLLARARWGWRWSRGERREQAGRRWPVGRSGLGTGLADAARLTSLLPPLGRVGGGILAGGPRLTAECREEAAWTRR